MAEPDLRPRALRTEFNALSTRFEVRGEGLGSMNISTAEMGNQEEPTITLITIRWVMVHKKVEPLAWPCMMASS